MRLLEAAGMSGPREFSAPLYGRRGAFCKRDQLAGVHYSLRIERPLDRAHRAEPRRIAEPRQLVELHLADAVLGRDRAARGGDEIVDEGGDRRGLRSASQSAPAPAGARDVEMDVAVAEMAEGDDAGAREARLDRGARPRR